MQRAGCWIATLGVLLMIAHANAFGDGSDDELQPTQVINPDCGPTPSRLVPVPDPIGGQPVDLYQLASQMQKVLSSIDQRIPSPLVADVVQRYLRWDAANHKERTVSDRKKFLNGWVAEAAGTDPVKLFGQLTVDELTPDLVNTWIRSHDTWGPTTRSNAARDIKSVFHWAVDTELLQKNPIRKLTKEKPNTRQTYTEPADYELIMTHVNDVPFRDLLTSAWETGARPFELFKVGARHVHLDRRFFKFDQQEGKGKRERWVYLNDTVFEIFSRLVKQYPTGPLLRNIDGKPWTNSAVACRFRRLKHKVGGRVYTQYEFRHGFATRYFLEGHDPVTVAKLMGHADLQMLNKVYLHLKSSDLLKVVNGHAIKQPS